MKQVRTIAELLIHIKDSYANPRFISHQESGVWKSLSTERFLDEVKFLALGLVKLGIKKDDKIGILAYPSPRWTIVDLAIMVTGAVSVPLFANCSEENFLHILGETELHTMFVGGEESWKRCAEDTGLFHRLIGMEESEASLSLDDAMSYQEMLDLGRELDGERPDLYGSLLNRIQIDDPATLIYTSGSTGLPKGAIHTHFSICSMLHVDPFGWRAGEEVYVSVLPLAHVYARMLNFIALAWNMCIYYFNDLKNLKVVCQQIRPSVLVVVPRLLERVYAGMHAALVSSSPLKRAIGRWAFDLANREIHNPWHKLSAQVADLLVFKKLRAALGGQVRIVLSGGAALDPQLYRFLLNIGIPVYEGWGLTESCPVTVNRPGKLKIGTVGQVLLGMEVKVNEQRELLVRGDNVMSGYYHKQAATAEVLDSEGWLHTGDQGFIDEEGYVTIVGRLKELLKTSTGELVAPVPIERALCKVSFIDMAMVVAEHRKFVSVLLVPDFDALKALKAKKKQSYLSDEEFLDGPYIRKEMDRLIERVNEHVNHWEQIHAYRFISRPLSIKDGEMTPSLKIVRTIMEKQFKDLIDSMYPLESI